MTLSPLFKYDVISDFRFVATAKNDCDHLHDTGSPMYPIPAVSYWIGVFLHGSV